MPGAPRRPGPYISSQRAAPAFLENEMTTTAAIPGQSQLPLPLVSAGTRIATALAVVAIVSTAWITAGHASRDAVRATSMALAPNVIHVTLPTVQITARRGSAPVASLATPSSL
jgi:hypothetical protein